MGPEGPEANGDRKPQRTSRRVPRCSLQRALDRRPCAHFPGVDSPETTLPPSYALATNPLKDSSAGRSHIGPWPPATHTAAYADGSQSAMGLVALMAAVAASLARNALQTGSSANASPEDGSMGASPPLGLANSTARPALVNTSYGCATSGRYLQVAVVHGGARDDTPDCWGAPVRHKPRARHRSRSLLGPSLQSGWRLGSREGGTRNKRVKPVPFRTLEPSMRTLLLPRRFGATSGRAPTSRATPSQGANGKRPRLGIAV